MCDNTVFSRVNRDSGTLHLPSDARFTPVFPGKMSVQKNPPASDQAETYLDIEREAQKKNQRATHAQEYLEHLDYCMHFLHVQQRGTTSFHERVQTSALSPKF